MTPEKFWSRVIKAGPDDCWLWTGSVGSHGYGDFRTQNTHWTAHRFALSLTETLRDGMFVLHSCDNHRCVNPKHLRQGTAADNAADMAARDRSQYGERSHFAKLTEETVRTIRRRLNAGAVQRKLAEEYGVHVNTIHYINVRKTWTRV